MPKSLFGRSSQDFHFTSQIFCNASRWPENPRWIMLLREFTIIISQRTPGDDQKCKEFLANRPKNHSQLSVTHRQEYQCQAGFRQNWATRNEIHDDNSHIFKLKCAEFRFLAWYGRDLAGSAQIHPFAVDSITDDFHVAARNTLNQPQISLEIVWITLDFQASASFHRWNRSLLVTIRENVRFWLNQVI